MEGQTSTHDYCSLVSNPEVTGSIKTQTTGAFESGLSCRKTKVVEVWLADNQVRGHVSAERVSKPQHTTIAEISNPEVSGSVKTQTIGMVESRSNHNQAPTR